MKLVAVMCLLAAETVHVYALPTGAPLGACAAIQPGGPHLGTNPPNSANMSNNPFQLDLSEFVCPAGVVGYCYNPGQTYQITLSGTNNEPFRGLLVQGRQVADASPVGAFSSFTTNTRASDCTPAESAVTHSNRNDKTSEVLTWTAPSSGTGPILFQWAVVVTLIFGISNEWYAPLQTQAILERTGTGGTMVLDPHYSILLPTGQVLCFTVHGQSGFSFNLISNKQMYMNALFVQDPKREEVTWIGSLGIVVPGMQYKQSKVTKLRFDASGKKIYVGDKVTLLAQNIEWLTFSRGKLSITEFASKPEHPVVHVDLQDVGLSLTVRFKKFHLDIVWNKVNKQPQDSHGLIGQFFREGIEIDESRKLLLLGPDMDPVPVMRKPVWSFMERETPDDQLCWAAMNPGYQGKRLIQGHYLDYLVDDVLSCDFKFKPKKHEF